MRPEYHIQYTWTNAGGHHIGTLTLRPDITTRPGHIGFSLSETITPEGGQPVHHMSCIVVPRELACQLLDKLGQALEAKSVPTTYLRQALDLVERATNNAAREQNSDGAQAEWGEIGHELDVLRRYL